MPLSPEPATLLVCCRAAGADPESPRAGPALLAAARGAAADDHAIRVIGIACLSGCKRACAAAVDAPAARLPAAAPLDLLPDIRRLATIFAATAERLATPEGDRPP